MRLKDTQAQTIANLFSHWLTSPILSMWSTANGYEDKKLMSVNSEHPDRKDASVNKYVNIYKKYEPKDEWLK